MRCARPAGAPRRHHREQQPRGPRLVADRRRRPPATSDEARGPTRRRRRRPGRAAGDERGHGHQRPRPRPATASSDQEDGHGGHHARTGGSVCAPPGPHQQDLVDAHPPVAEGHRAADEVEPPDPHDLLADQLGEPVAGSPRSAPASPRRCARSARAARARRGPRARRARGSATVSPTGRMCMSGAMNDSMNGPPPGCRCGRRRGTSAGPAPGRRAARRRAAPRRTSVVLLADVLAHLDRGDRVERSSRPRGPRGSPAAGSRPGPPARARGSARR